MPAPLTPTLSSATASWSGSDKYGAPRIQLALTIHDGAGTQVPYDPFLVDGTEIERSANGGGWSVIYSCGGTYGGANTPTTWDDTSAEDGTNYTYRVRVRDMDGNYSDYSDEKSALTILPKPGCPNGEAEAAGQEIKWEDPK